MKQNTSFPSGANSCDAFKSFDDLPTDSFQSESSAEPVITIRVKTSSPAVDSVVSLSSEDEDLLQRLTRRACPMESIVDASCEASKPESDLEFERDEAIDWAVETEEERDEALARADEAEAERDEADRQCQGALDEVAALREEVARLRRENERLTGDNARLRDDLRSAAKPVQASLPESNRPIAAPAPFALLNAPGGFDEMFEGEVREMVLAELHVAAKNKVGRRRKVVLDAVLAANPSNGSLTARSKGIKQILKDACHRVSERTLAQLEAFGFHAVSHKKDGVRLCYGDACETLHVTPSDREGYNQVFQKIKNDCL